MARQRSKKDWSPSGRPSIPWDAEITIPVTTGYWGPYVSPEEAHSYAEELKRMLLGEFPGVEVSLERFGAKTTGKDRRIVDDWLDSHWVEAMERADARKLRGGR